MILQEQLLTGTTAITEILSAFREVRENMLHCSRTFLS